MMEQQISTDGLITCAKPPFTISKSMIAYVLNLSIDLVLKYRFEWRQALILLHNRHLYRSKL